QGQAIALRVEGPALRGRQRLERVEAGKNELAQRIIAARQHPLRAAAANQGKRMANRIGAGSAGIGYDCDWAAETESTGQVKRVAGGLGVCSISAATFTRCREASKRLTRRNAVRPRRKPSAFERQSKPRAVTMPAPVITTRGGVAGRSGRGNSTDDLSQSNRL